MFPIYKCLVMQDYRKKRAENILPSALIRPTPAGLKRECMRVCSERFDRRDERALKDFFGEGGDKATFLKAIDRCDIDRLKPLANFLKGLTGDTDDRNIELLAWLTNFTPRPHEFDRKYPPCPAEGETPNPKPGEKQSDTKSKYRKPLMVVIILVLGIIGIYWLINSGVHGPGACMVWGGDRYMPTECGKMHGDTPVISLDSGKMARFRKITRPDTISENALDSIWYIPYHGTYEYYTAPGNHPIDTSLRLKHLNDYEWLKHVRPLQNPGNSAQ